MEAKKTIREENAEKGEGGGHGLEPALPGGRGRKTGDLSTPAGCERGFQPCPNSLRN